MAFLNAADRLPLKTQTFPESQVPGVFALPDSELAGLSTHSFSPSEIALFVESNDSESLAE